MRRLLIGIVLLALVAGACHGEAAVGASASYPLAFALIYEEGFSTEYLLAGGAFRWKSSAFLLDLGVSAMLGWPVLYGFVDLGVCGDLGFLRLALAGGLDMVRYSDPDGGSYSAVGLNAKLNLDFKLGKLTVGASATIPLDLLLQALGEDGVEDDSRILAAQTTINVLYWFGDPRRSKLR